jgi:hypothetical protein
VYRETNQYGVDALRRAVDLGYQQGYRAGQTDRRDGAPADFRRAFEYQNGNYGFNGNCRRATTVTTSARDSSADTTTRIGAARATARSPTATRRSSATSCLAFSD